jgi:hypothetical protein
MNLKTILLISGAQGMKTASTVLSAEDTNNTGKDDVLAQVLNGGADALLAYTVNNDGKLKTALKVIADTIYSYLGLTAPSA